MKYRQSKTFILLLLYCGVLHSCSSNTTKKLFDDLKVGKYEFFLQIDKPTYRAVQKMGHGSMYYVGLHLKQAGHSEAAQFYFRNGIKLYKNPFKNLCRLALYDIATPKECLYHVEDRLKELSTNNNTVNNDEKDFLNQLRCQNLIASQQYEKLNTDYKIWLQTVPLTPLITDNLKIYSNELPDFTRLLIEARIAVFEKNYVFAWKKIEEAFLLQHTLAEIAFSSLLSDIGKAGLYGGGDATTGQFFEKLLDTTLNLKYESEISNEQIQLICFYTAFYAARIYTRAGKQFLEKATTLFVKATEYAPSDSDFDTALWYHLDTLKQISFSRYQTACIKTALLWKNPQWYADLIQELQSTLLTKQDWKNLNILYETLKKINLPVHHSRIAYILAQSASLSHAESQTLLQEINNKEIYPLYYRILAAYHLQQKIPFLMYPIKKEKKATIISPEEAAGILDGLIKFGLLPMVYKQAVQFSTLLSAEKIKDLAQMLADNELYGDSIKMILLTQSKSPLEKEQLKLLYPRPWLQLIKKYAAEYNLPEYFLYAIIRSESFFNPQAISQAGAVGLMQLMPSTAVDIAKKLKITNYDLTEPDLNIHFGTYYIAEMIRRSNNQIMPACLAYNAGISRVRIWQKNRKNIPDDLFLENLEYGETREYGKRIFTAAMMYAYLYYERKPEDVVKEFFPHF